MSVTTISTNGMCREEWIEHRRLGIGGSDAAAIIGLNPWVTPYTIWADKTGRLPEKEDNEAMRQGRDLEAYVAERFTEETGKKVRRKNAILISDEYPFMMANIDREVVGEDAGLECKTTSMMNLRKFKNGEYPETYYVQCMHYMAVTGYQRWYLAVLVLNQGFYVFCIERDEDEIAALIKGEQDFWENYVVTDTPPPVDGLAPTTAAINALYPGGKGEVTLGGLETDLKNLCDVKNEIKILEGLKEKYEQEIKEAMRDYEKATCGDYTISWRSQSRSSFDAKAFAVEHPEMDLSRFYKTSEYRVFSVKGGK